MTTRPDGSDGTLQARRARGTSIVLESRHGCATSTGVAPDSSRRLEQGAIGWILLWVLGIPIPILLIFFLLRGCT
jgi:hypothetical protein